MPIHRIAVPGDAYVLAHPPLAETGASLAEAIAERVKAEGGAPPTVISWGLRIHARLGEASVRLGPGGLDDLLLSQFDARAGCAVLESALARLRGRGAIRDLGQIGDALALLARDPTTRVASLKGFSSVPVEPAQAVKPRRIRPPVRSGLLSVAILVRRDTARVARLVEMIGDQQIAGPREILLVASGLAAEDGKTLSALVEARKGNAGGPRLRLFNLAGDMNEAIQANTAVSLASGEVVVLIDPRCAPGAPDTLQSLAAWAAGAETLTACPRLLDGAATQLAAGLGLVDPDAGGGLAAWASPALSDIVRRTAAPTPYLLAVNRAAWLAVGGAQASRSGVWTAGLAEVSPAGGPSRRHLLVGPAAAVWLEGSPPEELRRTVPLGQPSAEALRAVQLADPGEAVVRALAPRKPVQSTSASFSDPFPSQAAHRLLVFADGYGASQSISFVEGLAQSRSGGGVAVRIVEEAAFGRDGPAFDPDHAEALVRTHMRETQPTAVALSRFGHARAYDVIVRQAEEIFAPLIAHLDDDLFDLPVCVGIERYRIARHPWRIHTLHRTLADADLVLATTDPLAQRLAQAAPAGRIVSLHPGAAGSARPRPSGGRSGEGPLVIGYMASASHSHDLEMIAPALNRLLASRPDLSLDLFGSISDQPAADLLKGPVRRLKPVIGDYWAFKRSLADLGWDIGLAPLRPIPYNLHKTATKWVEYAEAGIATVVSDVEVYREMIAKEAAVPARPDEWEAAVGRLLTSPRLRGRTVEQADRLLDERFGWAQLEDRLLNALGRLTRPRLVAAE